MEAKNIPNLHFILFCIITISCSSGDSLFTETTITPATNNQETEYNEGDIEAGRLNAVKKAYQMTDLRFTPLKPILKLNGTYEPDITYKGVMYSSAKELETFVGNDISFHTFMTAIHNPKSKIYTEDISQSPYHGKNCRSYYGAVCSSFVSYALGIEPRFWANDFPQSNMMMEIDRMNFDSIQVADVLWKDGHVAIITDIIRDKNNKILKIEICESVESGCKRYLLNREKFIEQLGKKYKKILRYKEIYKNTDYTPISNFVPVMDESPVQFNYNNNLCVDKGDKSCYLEEEDIIVNILHDYKFLEVYRDEKLYTTINTSTEKDIILSHLPYGDYKARICLSSFDDNIELEYSDYTYWKVINISVTADKLNEKLFFSSKNATPKYLRCRNDYGGSSTTLEDHIITDTEKMQGYIDIHQLQINQEYPFIRITFSTDYGNIINTPFNWFE